MRIRAVVVASMALACGARDSLAGGLGNDTIMAHDGLADGVDGAATETTPRTSTERSTPVTNVEHATTS